ncbi:unnamed protein product [Gongylonema pulchrum]|uniref:Uncharacterized protein n=1 Tax=Gongylonema pulchrum TaxID=637853 RepID=A0A183DJP7_9BILA|nr:unnamed protein product [Gongylonema pulchrum]
MYPQFRRNGFGHSNRRKLSAALMFVEEGARRVPVYSRDLQESSEKLLVRRNRKESANRMSRAKSEEAGEIGKTGLKETTD